MVAGTNSDCIDTGGHFGGTWHWVGSSAFCIHTVLIAMKNQREKELETMLTLTVAMVVLYLISKHHYKAFLFAGIVLGVIGLFSRFLTAKISWAWMKFAEILGAINSRVILTIIFYFFLFPIAMISKLFGSKNNLEIKKTTGNTYYFTRNYKFESKDLEKTW